MNYQEIINTCYCGDGPVKLARAGMLYHRYGKNLLADQEIRLALDLMIAAAADLDTAMAAMGMGVLCAGCAATPKGGCCSSYMGHENNDSLQLLMNVLAAVNITIRTDEDVECCFLGERGCVLLFKPDFCLNYLCAGIKKKATRDELAILEKKTGVLLSLQSSLEWKMIYAISRL